MGVLPAYNALVASARIIPPKRSFAPKYDSLQEQLWDYYDRLGEFQSGVSWRASAMSRIRLLAAELMPGGEEPRPLDNGPAADAVERLAGGTGGQAQLLREITIHLSVPGEGWMVGEQLVDEDEERWFVASADELRIDTKTRGFKLREDEDNRSWRPLAADSVVVRFWNAHPRFGWRANSDARHALNAMLELDLINKRIIAEILSRLTSNGILLYDKGKLAFPPVEQPDGADNVDPFAAILVDVASRAIEDPTSPEATIPIPIGFDMADLTDVDPKTLLQHVKLAEFLDEKLLLERDSAVKRLATSLDIPSEILLGMGGLNHWCVDESTEILTDRGWLTQGQLKVGDIAYTLNHETGLAQWQPVQDVYRAQVVDEAMTAMEMQSHSSLTTAAHRWPVVQRTTGNRGWRTTGTLTQGTNLVTAAPAADFPETAKWSDDFVELVAWYWTEGSDSDRGGCMIAQSPVVHPAHEASIRACLTRLFGSPVGAIRRGDTAWREELRGESIDKSGIHHYPVTLFHLSKSATDQLRMVAPDRVVTREFVRELTRAQLEWFVRVSVWGDGRHSHGRNLIQRDPRKLEAFELAATLLGHSVKRASFVMGVDRSGDPATHYETNLPVRIEVNPLRASILAVGQGRLARVTQQRYSGVLWCPVTPNGTWLARRNGTQYFTGNSAWQVEESGIKIHVAPFAELITHSLTIGYLIPMLKAQSESLIGPNGGRIVIWYDPSEITVRPDRSANTIQAYDRGEAPGRVLRREIGLSEDGDAPTRAELKDWLGRRLALADPLAGAALLSQLGGPDVQSGANGNDGPPAQPEQPSGEGEHIGTPGTREDELPGDASDGTLKSAMNAFMGLDDIQLLALFDILETQVSKLRQSSAGWVEAGIPNPARVTPARRNGSSHD